MKPTENPNSERDSFMLLVLIGGLLIFAAVRWIGPDMKLWLFSLGFIGVGLALILFSLSGEDYSGFFESTPREFFEKNETSIELGRDFGWGVPIRLPDRIRTQHVQILGGSGTGKTASFMLPSIAQDAAHKHPIIIVDGKADAPFLGHLERIARVHARKLFVFDLRGKNCSTYNPLSKLSANDAANLLMNSLTWSEPYYEARAREALKLVCRKAAADGSMTIAKMMEYFDSPSAFKGLWTSVTGGEERDVETESALNRRLDDCAGLRAQLDSLNSGPHALYLNSDKPVIDLRDAIEQGYIIYFRLPALADKNAAVIFGRLVLNDIKRVASDLQEAGKKTFCPVFIDEFAPFAISDFAALFGMGRSAGIALHISHQSLGDLNAVNPSFANQVIDNTATKIFFRLGDDETAEKAARLTGTLETTKVTRRANLAGDKPEMEDAGSLRDAHEFIYHPQTFKTLPVGQVILISSHGKDTKGGGLLTRRLRVQPLDPVFNPDPKKEEESKDEPSQN